MLIQSGRKRRGKKSEPEEFAGNLGFRPFGMLVTQPLPAQIPGAQTHLKSYEHALLS